MSPRAWVPPPGPRTQLSQARDPAFLAASLDAQQLQPWLLLNPRAHSFILLARTEALLLDASHVEHVGVGQRLLNALKFLLEGEARPG